MDDRMVKLRFSGIAGEFEVPVNDHTRAAVERLYIDQAGDRIATGTADAELLLHYALRRAPEPEPPDGDNLLVELTYLDALMERLQGDMEQARELVARLRQSTPG